MSRRDRVSSGEPTRPEIGRHRASHLDLAEAQVSGPDGLTSALVNQSESPLAWLARRKGRDGRALIEPLQLLAGERLRADFTRAQMMPRMTANWSGAGSDGTRGASPMTYSEAVLGARQRLRNACDAVGPEFSGLLMDVCCFLKGVPDVERDRGWPSRSGKVVLQLGLDRLARHYGLVIETRGPRAAAMRSWSGSANDPKA